MEENVKFFTLADAIVRLTRSRTEMKLEERLLLMHRIQLVTSKEIENVQESLVERDDRNSYGTGHRAGWLNCFFRLNSVPVLVVLVRTIERERAIIGSGRTVVDCAYTQRGSCGRLISLPRWILYLGWPL